MNQIRVHVVINLLSKVIIYLLRFLLVEVKPSPEKRRILIKSVLFDYTVFHFRICTNDYVNKNFNYTHNQTKV